MDDFEVIYTEADIKVVENKLEELNARFQALSKEKRETDVLTEALRDKVRSYEQLTNDLQNAKAQMKLQQLQLDDLHRQYDMVANAKNEQDAKLIKVMKEKHLIQQELDNIKQDSEQMTGLMINEMNNVRQEMTSTFNNQSKIQADTTRNEIQQLQQVFQQRLLDKQEEYEELNEQYNEKQNEAKKITLQLANCKEELAAQQKRVTELNQLLQLEKSRVDKLLEKLKSLEEEKADISAQFQEFKNKNREIQIQYENKYKNLSETLAKKDEQYLDYSQKTKSLTELMKKREIELQDKQKEIANLKQQIEVLVKQEMVLQQVQSQKSTLEMNLVEREQELSGIQMQMKDKERDLDDFLKQNISLQDKNDQLEGKFAKVQDELHQLKTFRAKLNSQLEDEGIKAEKLETQLKNVILKLTATQESLSNTEDECLRIRELQRVQELKISELEKKIQVSEEIIQTISMQNEKEGQDKQNLKQQIELMTQEFNRLNSLLMESYKVKEILKQQADQLSKEVAQYKISAVKSAENDVLSQQMLNRQLEASQVAAKEAQNQQQKLVQTINQKENELQILKEAFEVVQQQVKEKDDLVQSYIFIAKQSDEKYQATCSKKEELEMQLQNKVQENKLWANQIQEIKQQFQENQKSLNTDLEQIKAQSNLNLQQQENEHQLKLKKIHQLLHSTCIKNEQSSQSEVNIEIIEELICKISENHNLELQKEREKHAQQLEEVKQQLQNQINQQDKEQQEELLLKQKNQLKDLKFDLEQKIKTIQEENDSLNAQISNLDIQNSGLSKENKDLKEQTEYIKVLQGEIAQQYDKISQLEGTISSLQSMLDTQEIEEVILKKINENKSLPIEEEDKYQINQSILNQAQRSIENVLNHLKQEQDKMNSYQPQNIDEID